MLIRLCQRMVVDVHVSRGGRDLSARVSLPAGQLLRTDPSLAGWAGDRYRVPLSGGTVVVLPAAGWRWESVPAN